MMDWTVELHQLNGVPYQLDLRQVERVNVRADGHSEVHIKGWKKPKPFEETAGEVVEAMAHRVRELTRGGGNNETEA